LFVQDDFFQSQVCAYVDKVVEDVPVSDQQTRATQKGAEGGQDLPTDKGILRK